jgi:hypothetical protein
MYLLYWYCQQNHRIGGVMVGMLASSVVDGGEQRLVVSESE